MLIPNNIVYVVLISVIVVIFFITTKNSYKYILGLAIAITPWQGGLWIEKISMDFYMSTVLYVIVFILILFKTPKSKLRKKLLLSIFLPALGLFVGSYISASDAIDPNIAFSGPYMFGICYLIFFCVYNVIQKPEDIKFVVLPIAIGLLFEGILGIIQFRFWSFKIGVIDSSQSYMSWRSKGTFFHANAMGLYLLLLIPLAFRQTLLAFRGLKKKKAYAYLIVFLFGCGALFATQNRGSWIGLILAMIIVFIVEFLTNKTRMRKILSRLIIPLAIVLLLFSIRYGSFFHNRLFRDDSAIQMENRKRLQTEAREIIEEYPIFGVGVMNYELHKKGAFVHNLFVLITTELGFWGSFFFLWFLISLYWQIRKGQKSSILYVRNMSLAIQVSLFGFLISSTSSPDYLIDLPVASYLWILAGLVAGMNKVSNKYNPATVKAYLEKKKDIDEGRGKTLVESVKKQWASLF